MVDGQNWHLQSTILGGESSGWWNLNGWGVDRWEHGHPGPLASIQHSVMAWAIAHWPPCIVKGSAARYASLPTQVPASVSINMASLTLPKLRPSPNDSHKRGQPNLGPSLWVW